MRPASATASQFGPGLLLHSLGLPTANSPASNARRAKAGRNPGHARLQSAPSAKSLRPSPATFSLRLLRLLRLLLAWRPHFAADDHLHVALNRALAREHFEAHPVTRHFEIRTLHGRTDVRGEDLRFEVEHGGVHGDVQIRRLGFRDEGRKSHAPELDIFWVEPPGYAGLKFSAEPSLSVVIR